MKILILCRDLPLPMDSGEKIRCHHVIKELAKHHEVTLLTLAAKDSNIRYIQETQKICQYVYLVDYKFSKNIAAIKTLFSSLPWDVIAYYDKEMKSKLNELMDFQKYDLVWVNFLAMANYIDPTIASKSVFIFDQHNVDELVWKNFVQSSQYIPLKLFASINCKKVIKFQKDIIKYFSAIACCSKQDVDYMKVHIPGKLNVWLVPNGVDVDYFKPGNLDATKSNIIMLCASMDVWMNIEAAYHFAKEVFPGIKEKIPDSQFWIVGRNPDPKLRALDKEGYIKVTGSVADVRPYYNKARVVVAPYQHGGGTKLKILEAMSMNLPIVSTSTGIQGIDLPKDAQVYIRDNMNEFAEAIVKILQIKATDKNRCANNAREFVVEKYSWSSIIKELEPKLKDLREQNTKLQGKII